MALSHSSSSSPATGDVQLDLLVYQALVKVGTIFGRSWSELSGVTGDTDLTSESGAAGNDLPIVKATWAREPTGECAAPPAVCSVRAGVEAHAGQVGQVGQPAVAEAVAQRRHVHRDFVRGPLH